MIKAIIFDMDGVLIDSERIWAKVEKQFIESQGKKYKPVIKHLLTGANEQTSCQIIQREYNLDLSLEVISTLREKLLLALFRRELRYIPGALAILQHCRKFGWPLALATSTNARRLRHIKRQLPEFLKYFKLVVTGDQIKHSKPNPDIYLLAAKKLQTKPRNCLVIEDSKNGMLSAKRAGMTIIGLKSKWVDAKYLKLADYQVSSLRQIPHLILKIKVKR